MVTKFEELVHGMVNIGFGAAALTAEKGKEVLDTLNAKGEQVRSDATRPTSRAPCLTSSNRRAARSPM